MKTTVSLRAAFSSALVLVVALIGCQGQVKPPGTSGDEAGTSDGETGTSDDEKSVFELESEVTPCATPQRWCGDDFSVQYCVENDAGEEEWTECCTFEIADCECEPPWAGEDWRCDTPLVLAYENQAVRYTAEMAGSFDLTGVGMSVAMDWPTAETPWLALDRNGNGRIDDGGELFGSATRVGADKLAPNGFFALGLLDDNKDGVIDAQDAAFSQLLIWRDADASRTSEPAELSPAASELVSIAVNYKVSPRCDERGNCEVERASVRFLDAQGVERTGSVVDIHLRKQP